MTIKRLRAIALASAAALALSACGGTSDETADPSASEQAAVCEADGVLKIGNLLPRTGSLAFLGPPTFAGSGLAVQQINDAGGVLGQQVEAIDGDSGDTSTDTAVTTTDDMLQQGVDVIVGSASSGVTRTVIDTITDAGVLQISPVNTSTEFTDWPDRGLFFRTAPADQFQGEVLAQVAVAEQLAEPVVIARRDTYGESLAATFTNSFETAGGTMPAETILYDPDADTFETEVGRAKAASADAVVLIGFAESVKVIEEMIKQGIGPDAVRLFLVDANLSNSLYAGLPAGIMAGTKGTLPGADTTPDFRQQLVAKYPDLTEFAYSAEAYDAVNLVALAAVAAESDCGKDIAGKMAEVSSGGTKCSTFAECSELIGKGEDIDYDGQSGPIELDDNGDPSVAVMGVYTFGPDNKFTPSQFVGPAAVPALPQEQ